MRVSAISPEHDDLYFRNKLRKSLFVQKSKGYLGLNFHANKKPNYIAQLSFISREKMRRVVGGGSRRKFRIDRNFSSREAGGGEILPVWRWNQGYSQGNLCWL